ncbi:hypothetical protein SeLEV6574_g05719 [Synchytrium endobioticum]|nr:hypothetical protein SeLEV6574_g05719 [Synchytrium endobioticum]
MTARDDESAFAVDGTDHYTEHDATSPLLASAAPPPRTSTTSSSTATLSPARNSISHAIDNTHGLRDPISNMLPHASTTTTTTTTTTSTATTSTATILTQDIGAAYSFSHDHLSSAPRQSTTTTVNVVSSRPYGAAASGSSAAALPPTPTTPHSASRTKGRTHSVHANSLPELLLHHNHNSNIEHPPGNNGHSCPEASRASADPNQPRSLSLEPEDYAVLKGHPMSSFPIRVFAPLTADHEIPHNNANGSATNRSLCKSLPRFSLPNISLSPTRQSVPPPHSYVHINHQSSNISHAQDSEPHLQQQYQSQQLLSSPTVQQEESSAGQGTDDENDDSADDWVDMSIEIDFIAIEHHIMAAGLQHPRACPVATGSPRLRPATFGRRSGYGINNDNLIRKIYSQEKDERFVFYSEKTGVLKANAFEAIDFAKFDQPIADILRCSTFWLDITEPSHQELNSLCKLFNIHALTEEDIESDEIREKCEVFRNYYFVVFRTFEQHEIAFLRPIQMFIVVFRECVLSFHHRPVPHTINVLKRIEQLRPYGMTISPEWISYAIIDDVTDFFQPLLRYTELEVDTIDDLVLILKESEQSDMLQRIGHARKNRCGERMAPGSETVLYLGDIQDHILTMLQNVFHYETTISRSHSNYLASITIEITQASNKTNDVVMRMTALASVLIPLNVITGLWGMNVFVPGQGQDNYYWFFGIVTCMAVIAGTSFWLVRRHNVL